MLRHNEILLSTTDFDLARDIMRVKLPGVDISFYQTRAIDVVEVAKFVITFASDVAVGVLSAWLYERITKGPSKTTKVNETPLSPDQGQITVIINTQINVKISEGKENDKS